MTNVTDMTGAAENAQLFESPEFEPTPAAAQARIAAVRPAAYARTRNHIEGDVTRLSPYLTHGITTLQAVLAGVLQRGPLPIEHKFVYELAWREYFHHVWRHQGDGIFESLHEGVLPEGQYAVQLPADIRAACTGIPVIDCAVRALYATGYLHNHARMWLASYVVHLRKVHWRAGADWMVGHLLDGDLASNHLSWQWVAGTGSSKPYLFNAENVARYAPPAWHSTGSAIDASYEELDRIARSPRAVPGGRLGAGQTAEPALTARPPAGSFTAPDSTLVQGRAVVLINPWNLGDAPSAAPTDTQASGVLRIGILLDEFHARWPWSRARWQFVLQRMQAFCDRVWLGDCATLHAALAAADSIDGWADPHTAPWMGQLPLATRPALLLWPQRPCNSFSQFWKRATQGLPDAQQLLHRE